MSDSPKLWFAEPDAPDESNIKTHAFKLSLTKKLIFSGIILVIVSVPGWYMAEIAYRIWHGIPITGGTLYGHDLRLEETDSAAQAREILRDKSLRDTFLARFKRSDNPILIYEPRPGYSHRLYSINSQGFRDHEYPIKKDKDVFRIVVLGDSIVWGHGLPLAKTFAKQLETKLNAKGDGKFEVLNFGVSGYSTRQEVELFRVKASRYDPDLVIVGYCLNDLNTYSLEGEAIKAEAFKAASKGFKRLYYDIFSKSYLFEHMQRATSSISYNELGIDFRDSEAQFDLRQQFETLSSYNKNQRSIVMIFPYLYNFNSYMQHNEHDRIKDALSGLNYEILDLFDHYKDYDADSLMLNDGTGDRTHPNALGTSIAAEATLNLLEKRNLIP